MSCTHLTHDRVLVTAGRRLWSFKQSLTQFSEYLSKHFLAVVIAIVLLKVVLAAITPLGYDFVLYMNAIVRGDTSLSWSPWIILAESIYSFWSWLPLEHGDLLRAINGGSGLLPSHYLLTALIKSPLILCDIITTLAVYKLATRLCNSTSSGRWAALLWLANPLTTLLVEMWGAVDIIPVMLNVGCITLIMFGRLRLSLLPLIAGIALKVSPILTWLALIVLGIRKSISRTDTLLVWAAGSAGLIGYLFWVSRGQGPEILTSNFSHVLDLFSVGEYTPVTQVFSEYYPSPGHLVGFATTGVAAFYMIAAGIWPKREIEFLPLALTGILILYGSADMFPTAFLWVIPLLAVWNIQEARFRWTALLYLMMGVFIFTFYSSALTPQSSFLFIPHQLLPLSGDILVSASKIPSLFLALQIRAALAGVALAYAALVAVTSLRRKGE